MGDVIRFIPKEERERAHLIREARAKYDSIFPPARLNVKHGLGYVLCRVHWLLRNDAPRIESHREPQRKHCGRGQADAGRVTRGFTAPGHRRMVA